MAARDYQVKWWNDIFQAWDEGAQYVLPVLPTGGGKGYCIGRIVKDKDEPTCVMAHRQEIISQLALTLNRESVPHSIIAPQPVITEIIRAEIDLHGKSYYQPRAHVRVAGVNTLVVRDNTDRWFSQVKLVIVDEGHHVQEDNIFGKAVMLFPNARGLFPTAHCIRADGSGLGRGNGGLADKLVVGPSARRLIDRGFLADYRLVAPPSDVDVSHVPTGSTGDFNPNKLRAAMHESTTIVGDVVREYIRFAGGKLGLTFAVDIESAEALKKAYERAHVPAAIITGDTSITDRARMMRDFRAKRILQLVSVDVLGEGTDVPAVEVVSMARPTQSFQLFCLDPKTEILTPSGWCGPNDVFDSVIAFDPSDNSSCIMPVTGRIKRPMYDNEDIYGISNQHLDVRVSNKHNMLVRNMSNTNKKWQWNTAEEVSKRKGMFIIPVTSNGSFKDAPINDNDLRFLGWFLSDGCINKKTNGFSIVQSIKKVKHIENIRNCIQACGFKYSEAVRHRKNVPSTHADVVQFTISYGAPRGRDKNLTGWKRLSGWMNKSIPTVYDSLSARQLRVLIETLNLGDGANQYVHDYKQQTMTINCGTNKTLADRFQALCVQRGLRCNVNEANYGKNTWWYLKISERTYTTIAGSNTKDGMISNVKPYKRTKFEKLNDRPNFVWCISNDLGTLITRRNGRVTIMGNCQQFGRALRVSVNSDLHNRWDTFTDEERLSHIANSEKPKAIIIDHVGNWDRHGLPDVPRRYTLTRREKRSRREGIPLKLCVECLQPYESIHAQCPYCGCKPEPKTRSTPEAVEGDLFELDPSVLANMRAEIEKINNPPLIPAHTSYVVDGAIRKNHRLRQENQASLRSAIALWAGYWKSHGADDSQSYRRFFHMFGCDIMSAQALGSNDANQLEANIRAEIERLNVIEAVEVGG